MPRLEQKAETVIVPAIGAAGLVLTLMIVGCRPQPSPELPFETIEQVNRPPSQQRQPGLLIIATSQDVEEASPFVTDEARAALSQLDFTKYFAVLAFWGQQPMGHQHFRIERIVRQDNEVTLWAEALDIPLEGEPAETWPYHLIKVRKEGDWNATFTFTLNFGDDKQKPVSVSHYVP